MLIEHGAVMVMVLNDYDHTRVDVHVQSYSSPTVVRAHWALCRQTELRAALQAVHGHGPGLKLGGAQSNIPSKLRT